ncbi:hypothetical protein SFC27_10480 [Bacillus licheniformis]|nr:hypothetical protein [Bacillus licheniformis]MCU9959212.1 hypothetical protein [Bacillus licheniformis]MDE1398341.1 hypothetical protein [Bacillus licheniformis]MEC3833581.1 hypothetical protein [Bacillus licheniformis]MED1028768.1 hypothetical protein [Bacillus licheniformis]MED1037023.1 hypothetical protein [Bacillus licheniformis]
MSNMSIKSPATITFKKRSTGETESEMKVIAMRSKVAGRVIGQRKLGGKK